MSVALLIIFNHNYEANLSKLDQLYKHRFPHIFYVMPFYQGNRSDVITVYENSFYFQRYIADTLEKIKNDTFDHYIVIGDDLFLHPSITETNYKDFFQVTETRGFLPGFFLLNDVNETRPNRNFAPYWDNNERLFNFCIKQKGIEAVKFLPSYAEANKLLKRHGINFTPNIPAQMFFRKPLLKTPRTVKDLRMNVRSLSILLRNLPSIFSIKKLSYPIVGSYSDCLVIPKNYVEEIIRYFSLFAALDLFVEVAIPTAMAFAIPELTQEQDIRYKGDTYWLQNVGNKKIKYLEDCYKLSLNNLMENFPDNVLYIHPIKFSKWK